MRRRAPAAVDHHLGRGKLHLNERTAGFLTAVAVAKRQGTRSFQLRAALSLAKLYLSAARPADAHAVLAPALKGFLPTSEMPEIAEAQALLAALDGDSVNVSDDLSAGS